MSTVEAEIEAVDERLAERKFADELTTVHHVSRKPFSVRAREAVPVAVVFLGFIGLWYFVHSVVLDDTKRFLLPTPHDTIRVAFFDAHNRNELFEGIKNTGWIAIKGFVLAIIVSLLASVGMALARSAERAFFPWVVVLQTIPVLAITPLLRAWFQTGTTARLIVTVMISLSPIITSFLFGLKSADRGLHDLMTLHGANWWTRLRKVQLPSALPEIFTGLRVGAGLCVIGAIIADSFFTRGDLGLGRLIQNYANRLAYERLIGALILASMLGVAIYLLIGWIGNRMLRSWHESASAQS
jgi:NitT/TauT family transport system permease protein